MNHGLNYSEQMECRLCPRDCKSDRIAGKLGYCNSGVTINIGAICRHFGEEPVISGKRGILNLFFTRCNLQCIYCQNYKISRNNEDIYEVKYTLDEILKIIYRHITDGIKLIGFVSPSHFIPQVKAIIEAVRKDGMNVVFVYNSNGYDKLDTVRSLEGYIDVYLPDFKYMDPGLSLKYSGAGDYPEIATEALKEMFRQKGSYLIMDEENVHVLSGMIIRHLILPGCIENSIAVLERIATELSPYVSISLMSQYYPTENVRHIPLLNRKISRREYDTVLEAMDEFGFENGWRQELESSEYYLPDFGNEEPFNLCY